DQSALTEAALQGMVGMLDDHSQVLSKRAYAQLVTSARGAFAGVGIRVGLRHEQFSVQRILPNSPAASADIQIGDVIIKIDGRDVIGWPLSRLIDHLRGTSGTNVQLELSRVVNKDMPRQAKNVSVVLERQELEAVYFRARLLENRIVYAEAEQCYDTLDQDIKSALRAQAKLRANKPIEGLVLDLRGNPGGTLTCAIKTVDLFIDSGTIVRTQSHRGTKSYQASSATPYPSLPLAILVDGGTASAAEIIAGALQDYGRATVVGSQTFAKGSVQTLLSPLSNGSALKITTAFYLTPKGRTFSETGLLPDIEVRSLDENAVIGAALQAIVDTEMISIPSSVE
ncbi:MAG: S41 family peptidase, partial [Pseudomonadota bacterium]|nr:S41 family peptidase [Pseudomonadota bacterium]